ncbi:MAG: gamma-glutamylcyclotransferase [Flavisolibacter sp.]|nr:gamma-glutamylcyclotransferase [Flavisolibacter sp.]
MKENLFSYGTLQKDRVQLDLFGRLLNGTKDTLKGYKLSTIKIKDESVLSKSEQQIHLIAVQSDDKNDRIEGVVLEVTGEELLIADQYETDDYKRVEVELESGKSAWVYVAAKP